MLKKDHQQQYFTTVWASMLRYLHAFYEAQKPEDLHQFRVQVKKINALLFFLQGLTNRKEGAGPLQPLRFIYKHAGQIRSVHIHLQLIGQYQVAGEAFKTAQEKLAKTETKRFCSKRVSTLKMLRQLHQTLAGNFQDIKNKVILRLYKKRLKKLGRFFAKQDQPIDKLHKNRKKVKMLLYLRQALPRSLRQKLQLNTRYLHKLQDTIGKWNDVEIILELLKTEGFRDEKNLKKLEKQSLRLHESIGSVSKDFRKKLVL